MAADLLFFSGFAAVFLVFMLGGLLLLLGTVWATYDVLARDDLSTEQRLIYLILFWTIQFTWIIYLFLGKKRTAELMSDVDFL